MLDSKEIKLFDQLYDKKIAPSFKTSKGESHNYRITMDNIFLNQKGEVYKYQSLESQYVRNVLEKKDYCVWLLEYVLKSTKFKSDKQEPIQWNFVKDLVLPYYTFNYNYQTTDEEISTDGFDDQIPLGSVDYNSKARFDDAFTHLPKLPSVYLVIMMAYDIAGLENIAAHMCHNNQLFNSVGEVVELKSLSHSRTNIDMGFYSNQSYFENSSIYGILHGYAKYQGKYCAVLEYYSDASKVSIIDDSRENVREKTGNSYYSGYIYLDLETTQPIYGTMLENVIAVQSQGDKKVSVNIRRRVKMNRE